jgi:Holliday junction resolvase RusA-like endonuclease
VNAGEVDNLKCLTILRAQLMRKSSKLNVVLKINYGVVMIAIVLTSITRYHVVKKDLDNAQVNLNVLTKVQIY